MTALLRVAAVCGGLALALTPRTLDGQESCNSAVVRSGAQVTHTYYFDCVPIGDLVGAAFDNGAASLYAVPAPTGSPPTLLWTDEVVQLARVALTVSGDYRFSLELIRRGERRFDADDIGDPAAFMARLALNPHLVAARVRTRLAGPGFEAAASIIGSRAEGRLKRRISDVLNAMLGEDVVPLVSPSEVSRQTWEIIRSAADHRSPRLRRLVLEDLLAPTVALDVDRKYQITWRAGNYADDAGIRAILGDSRTERAYLEADELLKQFGTGEHTPPNVAFGPTLVTLCADEFIRAARAGAPITHDQFGTSFVLAAEIDDSAGVDGPGLWFRASRLQVVPESSVDRPRDCVVRFAESLTRHVPRLLVDGGAVGARLRNLKKLLTLGQLLARVTATGKVDPDALPDVPRLSTKNAPPPVMEIPFVFTARGRPIGLAFTGGVRAAGFQADSRQEPPADRRRATPGQGTVGDSPFEVSSVETPRRLLRIDISSLLGLTAP